MEQRWIWPFELEEQIGAGGMGVVYRARYVGNDRKVALKLLPQHVATNPALAARFEREMAILKDLRHPHIVHCFGGTCEGDQWFYAMQLVEGGSIDKLLRDRGVLPWERVVEYGLQICSALQHAHQRGVIHRDVKPANLLLTVKDKIKLSDFGLALVTDESRLTAAGKAVGTYYYMAPEQIRGSPPLSDKTDLYAFGCVLFEMLTGAPPFTGNSAAEILHKQLNEEPPRVSSVALDCPAALEALVADLLRKNPDERPASAAAVAQRLNQVDIVVEIKTERPLERLRRELPKTKINHDLVRIPSGLNLTKRGGQIVAAALAFGLLVGWGLSYRARSHSAKVEQMLVASLQETNPQNVRVAAIHSLADTGSLSAATRDALIHVLHDRDPHVRGEAALALGKLGAEAEPAVYELTRIAKSDEFSTVKSQAESALAQIRATRRGGVWPWIGAAILLACAAIAWRWKQQHAAAPVAAGVKPIAFLRQPTPRPHH